MRIERIDSIAVLAFIGLPSIAINDTTRLPRYRVFGDAVILIPAVPEQALYSTISGSRLVMKVRPRHALALER
jgi:hypothetical protein